MKKINYTAQTVEHIAMIMYEAGFTAWNADTMDAIQRMYTPNLYSMEAINGTMERLARDVRWNYKHLA